MFARHAGQPISLEAGNLMPERRLGLAATLGEFRRLRGNLRADRAVIEVEQLCRLRELVARAVDRVPLYGDIYPADAAASLTTLEDIQRLPVIDRALVVARPESDRCAGPPEPESRRLRSSGTSGRPLATCYPPAAAWWQGILSLRMTTSWGVRAHRVTAWIFADPDIRPARGLVGMIRRRIVQLPITAGPEELADRLVAARPALVAAPGRILADVGEALGGRLPRAVIACSGELLSPEIRRAVEAAWGRTPIDAYGTAEHGVVAWQCPAIDLYHLNHEAVLVEVLNERGARAGPGETGDLVISGLWNPHMPFLRYRIGDRGALSDRPCACGSALPALAAIQGRTLEHLIDDRGRRVAPQRLWLSLHLPPELHGNIERYRLRQDESGRTSVEIVASPTLTGTAIESTRASYQRVLGAGTVVEVRTVDRLEAEPSGKFRMFSSAASPAQRRTSGSF